MDESCHDHAEKPRPWYLSKSFLSISSAALLVGASYLIPPLEAFRASFFLYLSKIWWAILLGLFIGGIIEYAVPRKYFSYYLASHHKRTVLYAVSFGFLMSVCSHGILAIAMEIYKKGASTASVIAFLLASPWANLPLTLLLIGFFGWKGFFFVGGALLVAVVTGLIFQVLEFEGWVERNPAHEEARLEELSLISDFKKWLGTSKFSMEGVKNTSRGIARGAMDLSDMVMFWIVLGAVLASFAGAYIPTEIFNRYMGPTLPGILVTLVVATVMEVCSEGTAPLAFELYRQTGALGNAFVFLMAGVVTDYTEIGLLWKNVGRKTALWLPVVAVPQVIILGVIANLIF